MKKNQKETPSPQAAISIVVYRRDGEKVENDGIN